ncbi:hypothetical protein [Burkholderia ubonensis]|uniref:hypothetical protein n=1 Tax=Burkholderia ubonensis TaxID=101571 RepID=UPI0012FBE1FA|nr:hypothetical protein [Burkholderia ubonensis]
MIAPMLGADAIKSCIEAAAARLAGRYSEPRDDASEQYVPTGLQINEVLPRHSWSKPSKGGAMYAQAQTAKAKVMPQQRQHVSQDAAPPEERKQKKGYIVGHAKRS